MRWTKLKQLVERRFVASARGRLAIQITRYRYAHDDEGEFLLTFDGAKIYGSAFYQFVKEHNAIVAAEGDSASSGAERRLTARGVADHFVLQSALFDSLNQSVDEMLASHHPLIRALAVLDARCGLRRLSKLDTDDEHELVRRMYGLRRPLSGTYRSPDLVVTTD